MRGGINDAHMENNFDILQRLRSEWSYTGVSQRSTRHYEYFAAQHDTLALSGCSNFADVVRALEPRGGRSVEQRAHDKTRSRTRWGAAHAPGVRTRCVGN